MNRVDVVIVGGGQAGLAMSRCLSDRSIPHVVLERGRVAERWRTERWDSLRLLTPNWQSRLPGFRYDGPDPDGYMTMPELVAYLERYATSIDAPVRPGTTVLAVRRSGDGFKVDTDHGSWVCRIVVVATGYSDRPAVPNIAAALARDILQVVPTAYRNPHDLAAGGVLVVGASSTGIQLADEIHESGRPVTLAVGRHMRMPRRYRGRDILWWLDAMGVFDETVDDVFDRDISRRQPSFQLIGRNDRAVVDLSSLARRGVRIVGRATAADGPRMWFDDGLAGYTASSDAKLALLLRRIDMFAEARGLDVAEPEPFVPHWPAAMVPTPETLDLRAEGIHTVVWATGFKRSYPWLKVPVFDRDGEIRHAGGGTPAPGLYVLGMHFQRRRKSAFIDGVGADAAEIAADISLLLQGGSHKAVVAGQVKTHAFRSNCQDVV